MNGVKFPLNSIYIVQIKKVFYMPDKKKTNSTKKQKKSVKQRKSSPAKEQLGQIKLSPTIKSSPANLNNIIEVTEQEYNTNRFNTESIEQASAFIHKNKRTFWQKSFECLKHVFWCFGKKAQFSIVVKEDQILKTIQKLRTQKLKTKPFLPPLDSDKKTLVLDIDQTLVYSSQTEMEKYDFTFMMPFKKSEIKIYSKNRFGLQSFLFQMSKLYEIVIYTTNIREYVDHVLLNIDKKKRISHVLYKEKCLNLNKIHYLKSLKALGRDPDKVIFIDHNIASGILQPKNFLALKPYTGQKHDRQLVKLIPFLRQMSEKDTVIPVSKNCQEYFNRQIRLKFSNLEEISSDQNKQNSGYASKRRASQPSTKRRRINHQKTDSEIKFKVKQEEQNEDSSNLHVNSKDPAETEVSLRLRDSNLQQAM